MTRIVRDEDVCHLLPDDAVALLCVAVATSNDGDRFARRIAIDEAAARIRMKYPRFFRHSEVSNHENDDRRGQ